MGPAGPALPELITVSARVSPPESGGVAATSRKFRAIALHNGSRRGGDPVRNVSECIPKNFRGGDHPVCAPLGGFAKFLERTATPPDSGGDTPAQKWWLFQTRLIALALTLSPLAAFAQDEEGPRLVQIPNPMAAHTWFIIAAVGAFLAWCISYVLQFRRNQLNEKSDKTKRMALLHEKDELLDRLAQLESEKEAGSIPGPKYEKEFKKARNRLSDVLARLGGKGDAGDA